MPGHRQARRCGSALATILIVMASAGAVWWLADPSSVARPGGISARKSSRGWASRRVHRTASQLRRASRSTPKIGPRTVARGWTCDILGRSRTHSRSSRFDRRTPGRRRTGFCEPPQRAQGARPPNAWRPCRRISAPRLSRSAQNVERRVFRGRSLVEPGAEVDPECPPMLRVNIEALRGVAALRRGETENCVACCNGSSCIFPLDSWRST